MSVTEDGITGLMGEYLRHNGIAIDTQMSVSAFGARSQPDFALNNGKFYGEAKWENKRWEGFGQARDYGQLDGAKGSFLIIYPQQLKTPKENGGDTKPEDYAKSVLAGHQYPCAFLRRNQPTDMATLELDEIPNWIKANIEERHQPEPDPDEVISTLRQAARRLNEDLQRGTDANIFRNVLGITPNEDDERRAARETAGFLLVNQIVFYRVLSSNLSFPDIDTADLSSPADLQWYFNQVLEQDYRPVFSFPIADDLPQDSTTLNTVQNIVDGVYALSPEWFYHDILGKVFHELIPFSTRKQIAAYYTKNDAADILAHLGISDAGATVLDLACGSGTLLAAAYNRKRELRDLGDEFDSETHRQFVEHDLTGIDVMPFAAHLSCIHLALQAPLYYTDEINIAIKDSTTLEPGDTIDPLTLALPVTGEQRAIPEFDANSRPDIDEELVESGSLTLDGKQGSDISLDRVELVIINPPYSRQESVARFAEGYKKRLRERFSNRDQKGQIHGKMSFCSYFMFLADKFLESGGTVAAVLPASLLNKTTDAGVREMLLNEYAIKHILARTDKPNFSEDTDMREILIVAEKGRPSEGETTAYTSLDGLSEIDPTALQQSVERLSQGEIKSSRNESQSYDSGGYTTRLFPTAELEEHNLFAPFTVENYELFDLWHQLRGREIFTRLGDLEDPWLTGGLGFGGNAPDCKEAILNNPDSHLHKDDPWVVEDETTKAITARHRFIGETIDIPREKTEPAFHRIPYTTRLDLSDLQEYAVIRDDFDGIGRFFELGGIESYPKENWTKLAEKRLSHLGFMRRLDLTASGLQHITYYSNEPRLFHGMMFCLPGLEQNDAKRLSIWMDSSLNVLQMLISRVPDRGGWTKYHRNTVERFYIPDPLLLSEDDEILLNDVFDQISTVKFPSIAKQLIRNTSEDSLSEEATQRLSVAFPDICDELGEGFTPRRQMDRAILNMLNVPKERHERILSLLYPALVNEFVHLKLIMS